MSWREKRKTNQATRFKYPQDCTVPSNKYFVRDFLIQISWNPAKIWVCTSTSDNNTTAMAIQRDSQLKSSTVENPSGAVPNILPIATHRIGIKNYISYSAKLHIKEIKHKFQMNFSFCGWMQWRFFPLLLLSIEYFRHWFGWIIQKARS